MLSRRKFLKGGLVATAGGLLVPKYVLAAVDPSLKGTYTIMAKASNRIGQTQTFELIWNPAGYHHNVVQKITIKGV